ncbi:MAG: UDP-glucose 4-epimerase GalE [Acetanaerobacterium sp.]
MKIMVTGGAGFIGSHTCVELLNEGYEVVVVDNLCNAKEEAIDRIKEITGKDVVFCQTDVRDKEGLRRIFAQHDISAVVHFAGLKAVGESVKFPLTYYDNNVYGTIVLCQAMEEAGCRTIVFSSSATVYGLNNPIPYKEEFPTSAINPYGSTKACVEHILTELTEADGEWSAMLLRYFNPIGAHKSGLIGENPNGIPNNLLPYVAQVAVGKLPSLNVFGNDYDTPDGTGVRDYIHVVDLALGHIRAVDYALAHKGVQAVNLGTGRGTSVLEIVEAYRRASGKEIALQYAPRRAGDLGAYYADTHKAKALFGWEATRSIDDMCADSWRFMQRIGQEQE